MMDDDVLPIGVWPISRWRRFLAWLRPIKRRVHKARMRLAVCLEEFLSEW